MADLLPEKYKKNIRKEYRYRFVSVSLVFLFFVLLVSTLFLIPSHIILETKEDTLKKQVVLLEDFIQEFEKKGTETTLKLMDTKISILEKKKRDYLIREVILDTVKNKPNGVYIKGFSYDETFDSDEKLSVVTISGVADKRDYLLDFVDILEKFERMKEVDLPISNLTKDREVFFSIKLKI